MNFVDSIKLGFSNYVNFTGRACRSEYWYWILFVRHRRDRGQDH